jgi:hypothetical protein
MPGAREDYVIRMIREVVQALARLAGLRREGQFATAREELVRAKRSIGGDAVPMLDLVDVETAVHLLTDPRRALTYAQLLDEESALERAAANEPRAAWARERAVAIARLLAARPDAPDGVAALLGGAA